jgi:hypothetical protein
MRRSDANDDGIGVMIGRPSRGAFRGTSSHSSCMKNGGAAVVPPPPPSSSSPSRDDDDSTFPPTIAVVVAASSISRRGRRLRNRDLRVPSWWRRSLLNMFCY